MSTHAHLFRNGVYAMGSSCSVLEELGFDSVGIMKMLSVRGSAPWDIRQFHAKTTVSTQTNFIVMVVEQSALVKDTTVHCIHVVLGGSSQNVNSQNVNSQNVNSQNVNSQNINFPKCQLPKCQLLKIYILTKRTVFKLLFRNLSDCFTNRKFDQYQVHFIVFSTWNGVM